jgi:hypothetical protein
VALHGQIRHRLEPLSYLEYRRRTRHRSGRKIHAAATFRAVVDAVPSVERYAAGLDRLCPFRNLAFEELLQIF